MRLDGSLARNLGKGDTGIFSPRGTKLAIDYSGDPCYDYPGSGSSSDPERGLYLSDTNGSHRRRIAGDGLVGWLPSGRLIVQRGVRSALRLFDPLSRRVLMDVPYTDSLAMSCSGRVAISLPVNRGYELDIYTRVGGRSEEGVELVRRRVASRRYPFSDLAWSPDGRWLLFVPNNAPAGDFGPGSLWRLAVDGGRPRRLSHAGVRQFDASPEWSPDGRRIAFNRSAWNAQDDRTSITNVIMNADGSHVHAIARVGSYDYLDPAYWSPDSRSVAFDIGTDIREANAATGATERTSSGSRGLEDWQALDDRHPTRCADHQPAPLNAGTPTSS